ncbi:hypothetical protein [uncultured Jatrophihabitans sp.]|uniref:hypothetical protein n=1 Tax=uncultured Jatrophihabitans sp. TaxID=1610747 RepID=UPI0035CAF952
MPALLPSELPVRARTRYHWTTMFRPPHKILGAALVILLLAAIFDPNPMAWIAVVVFLGLGFLRWQTWAAEWVILTGKRIIRIQGVPETTSTEASLRTDRISGARLTQTVPGKLLDYGTIDLEAPGDHPDVRHLTKIAGPHQFYLELRRVAFGEAVNGDPDDGLDDEHDDFRTEPLPRLPRLPRGADRFGRRR